MDKQYCPYCMAPVEEDESCPVCGLTKGSYVPSPHHLPPGTVLMERYLVGRVLGEGGFGITYIGCDLRLEMKVAIKEYYPMDRATRNASASLEISSFIGPSAVSYERGKQKFLSEAQVMARMDKQQVIVSVRDFFEVNNTAYIVMEYIEGLTFRELVEQRGGKIAPEELFPMIEPLLHALSAIHENGLIHRDISPDNLMLENGKIRLLDFGCAREASRGTETMTIALKHGYAPIEQYQQKGQGPWTDIYALCATIYYCLTGKVPPQALDRIAEDELLVPSKLGVGLSDRQEKALLRGMRIQPNRRFSNVRELWAALYTTAALGAPKPGAELSAGMQGPDTEGNAIDVIKAAGAADSPKAAGPAKVPGAADTTRAAEVPKAAGTMEGSGAAGTAEGSGAAGITAGPGATGAVGVPGAADTPGAAVGLGAADALEALGAAGTVEEAMGSEGRQEEAARSKKKALLPAGIAAACIVLILAVIGISQLGRGNGAAADPGSIPAGPGVADGDTRAEDSVGGKAGTDDTFVPDPDLFQDAYVFREGEEKDFQKLMEDDSISAVRLEASGLDIRTAVVKKPVLLPKGDKWEIDSLTVEGEGYVQIEGELDAWYSGYIRLAGDGTRMYVGPEGSFRNRDVLLWMDSPEGLVMENEERLTAHTLVFDEETVFQDAISVSDEKTLLEAAGDAQQGRPISIDGDLTVTKEVYFAGPVRISEGVTVQMEEPGEGDWISFSLSQDQGSVLVNHGTFCGGLYASHDTAILNYGQLAGDVSGMSAGVSLWAEGDGTLVNFGTLHAANVSRFWEDSFCVNLGAVQAYDLYLVGGHMINYGEVDVMEDDFDHDQGFTVNGESIFWNKDEASVTVNKDGYFRNHGFVYNRERGSIVIRDGGYYANGIMENNGIFQAESGAKLIDFEEQGGFPGVFYGWGEDGFDIGNEDVRAYSIPLIYDGLPEDQEGVAAVKTEKDLEEALEDADVEIVRVVSDITVSSDLTVRKGLVIERTLTLAEDAGLQCYGSVISLWDEGTLQGGSISLYEDAKLYLKEGTVLGLDAGGTLLLDSALLFGEGTVRADDAKCILRNQAALALLEPAVLQADRSVIRIQDGAVFVPPIESKTELHDTQIVMEQEAFDARSFFLVSSETKFTGCTLDIGTGIFLNRATSQAIFRDCTVTIGKEARFDSELANLGFLGDSSLEVWGDLFAGDWDEHRFSIRGSVVNHGRMGIFMHTELSEPIDNQGEIETLPDCLDISKVNGNAPKVLE